MLPGALAFKNTPQDSIVRTSIAFAFESVHNLHSVLVRILCPATEQLAVRLATVAVVAQLFGALRACDVKRGPCDRASDIRASTRSRAPRLRACMGVTHIKKRARHVDDAAA